MLPLGRRFAEQIGDAPRVERGALLKTRDRGTLLLMEEPDQRDPRALVVLRVAPGYRGGVVGSCQFYDHPFQP